MCEYRERERHPGQSTGGVVVVLVMAVLGGGLMLAELLWTGADRNNVGYLTLIGLAGVCFGLARSLYALSRLPPYLRYWQANEPEVPQRERHKTVALVAGVLVVLLLGELVHWLVLMSAYRAA